MLTMVELAWCHKHGHIGKETDVLEAWKAARSPFLNLLPQSLQTRDLAPSGMGEPSSSSSSSALAVAAEAALACSSSKDLSWFSSSQLRAPCTASCQYYIRVTGVGIWED